MALFIFDWNHCLTYRLFLCLIYEKLQSWLRCMLLFNSQNKNVKNCRNNQNIWQKGVKLLICCKIRKPSEKSPHKESNIYGGCPLILVLQECDKGQIFYWSIQTCSRIMRLFVDCHHAQKPKNRPLSDFFDLTPKNFLPLLPYTDLVPPSTDPVPPSTN